MKQTFYPLCLALGLLATACSSDSPTLPDNQPENTLKTPITFSSGVAGGSVGRDAVITSGEDRGFTSATDLVMHIRSVNSNDASEKRYTRTTATAQIGSGTQSSVTFDANDYRYWDDAYGRAAQLSVFAVAVADKKFDATSLNGNSLQEAGNNGWTTTAPNHTLEWTVSETQTETTIAQEDLVYSNNNRTGSEMTFKLDNNEVPNGPGKFDTGELKFDHALTRITVKLKAGKGFDGAAFAFTNSKNVELVNMPTKGTLDVENGTWTLSAEAADKKNINTHKETTNDTGISHTLRAQIFPNYSLSSSETATNMMQFTIDENTYYVTQAIAYKALFDNKTNNGLDIEETGTYSLAQGKNYIFTITVNKAAISVTATVAKWADVEAANIDKNNAHLNFDFKTPDGGTACNHFDLYRLKVESSNIVTDGSYVNTAWTGNYTTENKASLEAGEDGKWSTDWYYESNKEFYHLRTVDKDMEIKGNDNNSIDDYFEIKSGAVDNTFYSSGTTKNPNYNDYHWGAPMTVSDPTYDVNKGYADNIYHAVGATEMPIKISEFHTMSDIHVVLKTTDGDDAVTLFDNGATPNKHTTVTLMRYYPNGTVLMGNGLVSTTESPVDAAGTEITAPSENNSGDYYETDPTKSKAYTYRVVPQPLDYNDGEAKHIGLEIQTPDDNVYYINQLSTIVESVNSTPIDRWYPGKRYTYTFTLKKTGIQMTCTVANWKNITASDTEVDLTNKPK